jgi:hypothetical protein
MDRRRKSITQRNTGTYLFQHHIQGTFSAHSGNVQRTFRERSVHFQETYSAHSGDVQCTFRERPLDQRAGNANPQLSGIQARTYSSALSRERSVHFQGTFSAHSRNILCGAHSGNVQCTFRERSVHFQGMFSALSGNNQCTFREHSLQERTGGKNPQLGRVQACTYSSTIFRERSVNIQGTFSEYPGNIQ